MRKLILVLLVGCVIALAGSVGVADAQFITQVCWQLNPFNDVLRVSLTQSGSQISLSGVQFVNGPEGYSLPFSGSLFLVGNQAVLGGTLIGDLQTFNKVPALALYAVLSTSTGGGTLFTTAIGGGFEDDTTLSVIACPGGPTTHDAAPSGGKAQGRQ